MFQPLFGIGLMVFAVFFAAAAGRAKGNSMRRSINSIANDPAHGPEAAFWMFAFVLSSITAFATFVAGLMILLL